MVLTKEYVTDRKLVIKDVESSKRATTYDATVGSIILGGCRINSDRYVLKPRGIVWVISSEEFRLPSDITGLATLKTTWTHQGILALNLGVIDPGWEGPLATAIINFSTTNFPINIGDPFFRVLFFQHGLTDAKSVHQEASEYERYISRRTSLFSDTFLTMNTLVPEVSSEVMGSLKWPVWIGLGALCIAVAATFFPIAWTVYADSRTDKARIDVIEKELLRLKDVYKSS